MYRLCDEKGLVCWAEIPVTQSYVEAAFDNAKQQLIELIRQNYNHPSILFIGLHNEAPIPPQQVKILNVMAKKEDPQRLTTAASPWTDTSTVTDLICWNRYPGWYDPLWDQTADIGSTWADPKHKKQPDLNLVLANMAVADAYHTKSKILKDLIRDMVSSFLNKTKPGFTNKFGRICIKEDSCGVNISGMVSTLRCLDGIGGSPQP